MQSRWKSWALWLALAAVIVFVVMQATGIDISEPVNAIMVLLLPVLVAFGIINDPTVRAKLFSYEGQLWYQSWAVWLALAALITYCVRLFFNLDVGDIVGKAMDVLLPVLVAFGIINDPTVRAKLFSYEGQLWYQSWAVWLALAALITYCVRLFFNLDVGDIVGKAMDVLLPVLMAFGIVNSPGNKTGL